MATKKAKAPKEPHLSVKVTEEQIERWNKAAEADQRTLSSWVRYVLDKASAK